MPPDYWFCGTDTIGVDRFWPPGWTAWVSLCTQARQGQLPPYKNKSHNVMQVVNIAFTVVFLYTQMSRLLVIKSSVFSLI